MVLNPDQFVLMSGPIERLPAKYSRSRIATWCPQIMNPSWCKWMMTRVRQWWRETKYFSWRGGYSFRHRCMSQSYKFEPRKRIKQTILELQKARKGGKCENQQRRRTWRSFETHAKRETSMYSHHVTHITRKKEVPRPEVEKRYKKSNSTAQNRTVNLSVFIW